MSLPKKVTERLVASIKRFQPIVASAKARDVNESDTVIIVTDMIAELFGFDKYSEITSEHAIRSTFCDLAIRLDGAVQLLVEVKAIGLDLKDAHVKQAVDYAANQGVDWVVLTNAETWRVYKVIFGKPVDHELVLEVTLPKVDPKSEADLGLLYTLSKEGWQKSALGDFHEQRQALSRFFIAAIVLTDPIIDGIRRELRRVSPDVKIEPQQIRDVLLGEVLKRDVVEGDRAELAAKRIRKAAEKALRAKQPKKPASAAEGADDSSEPTEIPPQQTQPEPT